MKGSKIMGKRKTHEEFVAEVNKLNPHIEISGLYVNAQRQKLVK